jgi:hypothetical protein
MQNLLIIYFIIGGISAVVALVLCILVNEEYQHNNLDPLEWDVIFQSVATAYVVWWWYWYRFITSKDE